MQRESIVKIKKNFKFKSSDLAIANKHLESKKEILSQIFTNEQYKSMVVANPELQLIDASLIISGESEDGRSNTARHSGINPKLDELSIDIEENGYRLNEKPIIVRRTIAGNKCNGGKFVVIDGRTRDMVLSKWGVENRICFVIDSIDESDEEDMTIACNLVEYSPAGYALDIDIVSLGVRKIEAGRLELDPDTIQNWVNITCAKGKFGVRKRSDISGQIYWTGSSLTKSGLLPVAWPNQKEVTAWLEKNKYIDTKEVAYIPFATSSSKKALIGVAKEMLSNPGKEIRVVIYVTKLTGYNLGECYIKSVLKFREEWDVFIGLISNAYFDGKKPTMDKIKIYGYVPSNVKDVCDDMSKLIVIGKNDQNIIGTTTSIDDFEVDDFEES